MKNQTIPTLKQRRLTPAKELKHESQAVPEVQSLHDMEHENAYAADDRATGTIKKG